MATNEENRVRDTFLRTIAVVGLVAVLLLGAWGIIQLAVALPSLFGSLSGGVSGIGSGNQQESIALSAPATIPSGQPLTVSWNHQNAGSSAYSYAVSYSCVSGVSVNAPLRPAPIKPLLATRRLTL